jgi:hypothetical protein
MSTPIYDQLTARHDSSDFQPALPRDIGPQMDLPTLLDELDVCAFFADGTKNGELVELADFTRHRMARALSQAGLMLEAMQRVRSGGPAGLALIVDERLRQMSVEGYSPEGDIGRDHELIAAAECYLLIAQSGADGWHDNDGRWVAPGGWPWPESTWKPTDDKIRDLTKSAALMAAALDVLIRQRSVEEAAKAETQRISREKTAAAAARWKAARQ